MTESQYEDSAPLVVIARYDPQFLSVSANPFGLVPTPEDHVAEWSERDPSLHYFFVEISSDISSVTAMTVSEYRDWVKESEAAARIEAAEDAKDEAEEFAKVGGPPMHTKESKAKEPKGAKSS